MLVQSPSALPVPQHQAVIRLVRHGTVLRRVVSEVPTDLVAGADVVSWPLSKIISAFSACTVHNHLVVALTRQILLDRSVRAVRVPDEDCQSALHDVVETAPDF